MSIKAVLFDMDGTLLPVDYDVFVKTYFGLLAQHMTKFGYQPQEYVKSVWSGTKAMIKNDGTKTNSQAFWDEYARIYGENARQDETVLNEFYVTDFDKVRSVCGENPKAAIAVREMQKLGLSCVLATNPLFPECATISRMRWVGLEPGDFVHYTTYENSSFAKPSIGYYKGIVEKLGLDASECLMVGNDVDDDMVPQSIGMKVFLLTDFLINEGNKDISIYPNGSFDDLINYVKANI